MIRKLSRLGALSVFAVAPALLGADGNGCSAPPPGAGGSAGAPGAQCRADADCIVPTVCQRCARGSECATPSFHCTNGTCAAPTYACPAISCGEQVAVFTGQDPSCTLFKGYKWDGFSCASTAGCEGTCIGADCGELYPDVASCQAAHQGCPGYDCTSDPHAPINVLLEAHRHCTSDAQCEIVPLDCCSTYANGGIYHDDYIHFVRQAKFCHFHDASPFSGCLVECGTLPPPVCLNGVCTAPPAR